jgi:hypothetical protein
MGEHLGRPVPAGARLLHIGPHKTGTTSVQGAFHRARAAILAQGVRYAGPNRHPVGAAQAIIAAASSGTTDAMGHATSRAGAPPPRLQLWHRLVNEVRSAPEPRVVISSEWLADADDPTITRIVGDLGRDTVHVVITVRPLERLLPSQWQQYAQAGFGQPYEDWLASVLARQEAATSTPSFWRRHRHDELARRWADAVGPDHVTVVVVDDRDHGAVLRAFEELTGLQPGTLRPEPAGLNRSLTGPEIDVVRAINAALTAAGVTGERRLALGLYGAAAALRRRVPAAGEARVVTPAWAVRRARELGAEIAAGLAGLGVGVVGDLADLANHEDAAARGAAEVSIATAAPPWSDIVGTALGGVATTAGLVRRWPDRDQRRDLDDLSTARLREVLAARAREIVASIRRRAGQPLGAAAASLPEPEALTRTGAATLEAIREALRAQGVSTRQIDSVLRAAGRELGRRPTTSDGDDAAWLAAAGAAAVGIARARALVPNDSAGSSPSRRRATVETLEVAGVATPALAWVLAVRLPGALAARLRPARAGHRP